MFLKFTVLCVLLGLVSLSAGYVITPNIVDGVPESLDIATAPFIKIGENYYLIETKRANWFDAFESCRQKEADLVAFESLEELQLVSQYIINNNLTAFYWTSGTDLAKQDEHVWFSSGQPVASDLWREGEPNNANDEEHCDDLKIQPERGVGLNDKKCSIKGPYICKAPQPKTASFIVW
ncbi:C-type lectin 37Da [Drosophila biarmipes]|uniref:C-type lectin 37Da n=1 Tax=Drosophila biarmipes TaxID=125945 RepID=UPI001CDB11DB|nr:C-type lectin 37Da [Drosophila biarmipes]